MTSWLLVALGGAVGTVLRRMVGLLSAQYLEAPFPLGTLAVNVLGSFSLGLVYYLAAEQTIAGVEARLVLGTGVMGGFTTYSSFNLETLLLLQQGQFSRALLYLGLTLTSCIVAGFAGLALGKAL